MFWIRSFKTKIINVSLQLSWISFQLLEAFIKKIQLQVEVHAQFSWIGFKCFEPRQTLTGRKFKTRRNLTKMQKNRKSRCHWHFSNSLFFEVQIFKSSFPKNLNLETLLPVWPLHWNKSCRLKKSDQKLNFWSKKKFLIFWIWKKHYCWVLKKMSIVYSISRSQNYEDFVKRAGPISDYIPK